MKTKSILWCLALLVLISACKKEEAQPTRTELITKTWQAEAVSGKLSGLTLEAYKKGGSNNLIDFSKFRIEIKSDGNATLTNYDGSKITGKWKFTNNENSIDVNNGEYVMDITELTSTTFKFDTKIVIPNDDYKALGITKGSKVDASFVMSPL